GDVLLALLRRLPRAREGAALRRADRRGRAVGESRPRRRALDDAPAVRAVSAVRDGRSLVVVARGLDPSGVVADARGAAAEDFGWLRGGAGGRRAHLRLRDRRDVRSPQAAVRSQTAVEGADRGRVAQSRTGRARIAAADRCGSQVRASSARLRTGRWGTAR